GRPYLVKHTMRYVCASVVRLRAVIDPITLERRPSETLALNEFAEVEIETHQPLYADPYGENRVTGAFVLVEPVSNETVAVGKVEAGVPRRAGAGPISKTCAGQGLALWFTGLSSPGKST